MEIENEKYLDDDLLLDNDDTLTDRYLTFRIADEFYGIEIKYVIEIIGIQNFTKVPNIKSFIKGVINLRGNIVPVLEVRLRFGLPEIPHDERTCIIVVKYGRVTVGLIVDEVSEVMNIPAEDTSPPSQTNKGNQSKFIQCFGKVGTDVKILLNLMKLLYDVDVKEE